MAYATIYYKIVYDLAALHKLAKIKNVLSLWFTYGKP